MFLFEFSLDIDLIVKTPLERAHILEHTSLFAEIHAELAASGQTPTPTDLDTDLHFTCFVQAPEAAYVT